MAVPGIRTLRKIRQVSTAALDRREVIHFLHIGKNAGTQIKHIAKAFNKVSETFRILPHTHDTTLRELAGNERYFFAIRDPVTRFESGFYSRQQKGQPRINSDWSPDEKIAFSEFSDANSLAEALFGNGAAATSAFNAMRSISHVAMHQHGWFAHYGQFLQQRPPVHIIRQEHFDADLAVLLRKLALNEALSATDDPVAAHKNDYAERKTLSPRAIKNLERWYAIDIQFYRQCSDWIAQHS